VAAVSATYSVVIPAYNAEKTIEACLASVLAQTIAPLEILVVDDHSFDETEVAVGRCEVRLAAAGIRLEYCRLAQNAGPSVARNKGIRMAKGSYIAFLDADDTWHKDKLAIVDRHLRKSSADLVCHTYTEEPTFDVSTSVGHHEAKALSIYRMLLHNPAQTSCAVVRKQHALAFDEAMRHCEDYDLWMRIAENTSVLRLVGPPLTRLGRPQLTAGGLSGNTARMRIGEVRVYYNFCQRAWLTLAMPADLLAFEACVFSYSQLQPMTINEARSSELTSRWSLREAHKATSLG
jgi:glycosyltransferase involved in cell wall biosynthesis